MTVQVSLPVNQQQVEKQFLDANGILRVVNVWGTIQGEGPFVGTPAIFVRLAGCNLQCPQCDTNYTDGSWFATPKELTNKVKALQSVRARLVVLTGGEPFRQNIAPFVRELLNEWFAVQIETNGTLHFADFPYASGNVTIVCSPKTPILNWDLRPYIQALKYVLDAEHVDGEDGLPTTTLGNNCSVARPWERFPRQCVYVQPADHSDPVRNKANQDAAIASCLNFGYRLCLQVHKLIGVE